MKHDRDILNHVPKGQANKISITDLATSLHMPVREVKHILHRLRLLGHPVVVESHVYRPEWWEDYHEPERHHEYKRLRSLYA